MDDNAVEQLLKEIADKHGILVGRDDPILILQTINQRLLQDGAKAQEEQLQAFAESMEEISNRWSLDAKSKAEKTLTAALKASKEAMANEEKTASTHLQKVMAYETKNIRSVMRQEVRRAKLLTYTAIGISIGIMLFTLFILLISR